MAHKIEKPANLLFHRDAFEYAKELIRQGRVNCSQGSWTVDQPTPDSENAFLKNHKIDEYGKWFLGTKQETNANTKEHYEFPIGNFNMLFRSGVIAAKQRAAQFKHTEIENAAAELLQMMDETICKA